MNNEKLTSLQLNHDENGYYLRAEYKFETKGGKYRKVFPHVELTISENSIPEPNMSYVYNSLYDSYEPQTVNLGFGNCIMKEVDVNIPKTNFHDSAHFKCMAYIETLEEYTKELTIDEIERELGYKIKIVNK